MFARPWPWCWVQTEKVLVGNMPGDQDTNIDVYQMHENRRQNAFSAVRNGLREYSVGDTWPICVLPPVADLTFSDGAAFMTAHQDGVLVIQQAPASAPGRTVCIGPGTMHGEIWKACMAPRQDAFYDCHLPARVIEELGVLLPERSSIMAEPLTAWHRPHSCICVWRADEGGRWHSRDAYEVWDLEQLRVAAQVIGLTIDAREYAGEATRLQAVQASAKALLDAIRPTLLVLHEFRDKVQYRLAALDEALSRAHRALFLGATGERG